MTTKSHIFEIQQNASDCYIGCIDTSYIMYEISQFPYTMIYVMPIDDTKMNCCLWVIEYQHVKMNTVHIKLYSFFIRVDLKDR